MVILAFAMLCVSGVSINSQAQGLPSINLECMENMVDFDLPNDETATVHCTLENPNAYSEVVELAFQTGELDSAGPESVTVEAGSEVDFELVLRADASTSAGNHEVNITAHVTQAGGVPVGFITDEEIHGLEAFVPEFLDCVANYGQASASVEGGEDIAITASFACDSNRNQSFKIELHLVSSDASGEEKWPSGFNDMSEQDCVIEITGGSGMANCQFLVSTPSNLVDDWDGCLVILPEEVLTAGSCSVEDSLAIVVSAKESSAIDVGFGQNGTLLGDLGVSEESEPYVIGGTLAVIAIVIGAIVMLYRKRAV